MDQALKKWTTHIGHVLRERRKSLGLSLEEMSRLSGATAPTLSHIERGNRDVKLSTLVSLAEALRIDLPDLFIDKAHDQDRQDFPTDVSGYDLGEN
jgi:transcriptional regulator with XRE-family HTH domain